MGIMVIVSPLDIDTVEYFGMFEGHFDRDSSRLNVEYDECVNLRTEHPDIVSVLWI